MSEKQRSRTDAIVLVVVLVLYAVGTNIGLAFKEANDRNTQLQNEIARMKAEDERH